MLFIYFYFCVWFVSPLSESENIVPQWAFKFNSALAAAETWHLEDCTIKVDDAVSC
jgi:hypothetical protein